MSYTVSYKESSAPDESASWTNLTDLRGLSVQLTGLSEWESYDVEVAAVNAVGLSDPAEAQGVPHRGFSFGDGAITEPFGVWSDYATIWMAGQIGTTRGRRDGRVQLGNRGP